MLRDRLRRGVARVRAATGRGGWIFSDAQFLSAEVELDPRAARRWLPWQLRLARPARAIVFFAHYPSTAFGSVYSEAGVLLRVRHGVRRAVHCPWMLVDDDVALIAGRELLGYPKKLGEFDLTWSEGAFAGTVTRRGVPLLSMTARLGAADPSPPPLLGQRVVNVMGGLGLAVQRTVAFEPAEHVVEAREASATLRIGAAERDPLHELGIGEVVSAHYRRIHIGGRRLPLPMLPVTPLFWLHNWPLRYT